MVFLLSPTYTYIISNSFVIDIEPLPPSSQSPRDRDDDEFKSARLDTSQHYTSVTITPTNEQHYSQLNDASINDGRHYIDSIPPPNGIVIVLFFADLLFVSQNSFRI
jgi:hypothetical protein